MAGKTRVPKAQITGMYGGLMKRMSRKMLGQVPESLEVMWHNPTVLKQMLGFGRKVERWDRLDPSLSTFAAMAAAAEVGCSFCLDLNYFMARNRDVDETKVREVPRWRESDAFSPLERSVMAYAEAASQTPPAVTDELSNGLLAELGPAALVELAARVGFMNMSARMNIALGIHSEEFALACGLPPLAERSALSGAA